MGDYMKILLIVLICFALQGASSNKRVYTIISEGESITNSKIEEEEELALILPAKEDKFKTGTQREIEDFNKSSNWKIRNSGFQPQPFSNRTNSYWIFPNFQFGPGSVNDFGNNPNAQQMLGPYIF